VHGDYIADVAYEQHVLKEKVMSYNPVTKQYEEKPGTDLGNGWQTITESVPCTCTGGGGGGGGDTGWTGYTGWTGRDGTGWTGWTGWTGYTGWTGPGWHLSDDIEYIKEVSYDRTEQTHRLKQYKVKIKADGTVEEIGWDTIIGAIPCGCTGGGGGGGGGDTGWTGYTGWTGWTGWTGYTGWTGRNGSPGGKGDTGWTGWTGYTGYTGWTGPAGSSATLPDFTFIADVQYYIPESGTPKLQKKVGRCTNGSITIDDTWTDFATPIAHSSTVM
jgi:hypothetical protein